MKKKNQKYYILVGVAILLLILSFIISGYYKNKPGEYDAFANCIKESGAKFYGAFWCSHCQEQKTLFSKSKDKLPYVECSTANAQGQNDLCKEKNITGYPTWDLMVNGTTTRINGVMSFTLLSSLTNCPMPEGYVDEFEQKKQEQAKATQEKQLQATSTASTTVK